MQEKAAQNLYWQWHTSLNWLWNLHAVLSSWIKTVLKGQRWEFALLVLFLLGLFLRFTQLHIWVMSLKYRAPSYFTVFPALLYMNWSKTDVDKHLQQRIQMKWMIYVMQLLIWAHIFCCFMFIAKVWWYYPSSTVEL